MTPQAVPRHGLTRASWFHSRPRVSRLRSAMLADPPGPGRHGGVRVQERRPLPVGDRGPGQLGDFGGEVGGDGVHDRQRLAGLAQP